MTQQLISTMTGEEKRELLASRLRIQDLNGRPQPASYQQQRMWFLHQMMPGSAAYNIPAAVRIVGPLDVDAWRASLRRVAFRHDVLRTTLVEVDGQPCQLVHSDLVPEVAVVDVRPQVHRAGTPVRDLDHAAVAVAARTEFTAPFDLERGPLLRMRFLQTQDQEHVLLMTTHHALADVWSTTVLLNELVADYTSRRAGDVAPLPPVELQYCDYARWQAQQIPSEVDLAYWREHLDGAPSMIDLPTDRPRPAVRNDRGASLPFTVDAARMTAVRTLAQQTGTTPFMVLLAVFSETLRRFSRQDDVVVGVPVANRNRRELQNLVGYFANMLPLRFSMDESKTLRDVLMVVRESARHGMAHQGVLFEEIVDEIEPERDPSRSPIFQVSFIYQNVDMPDLAMGELALHQFEAPSNSARFDLELQLFEDDGLSGHFEYNTDLFDAVTMDGFSAAMQRLLNAFLEDLDAPLDSIGMLDGAASSVVAQGRSTCLDPSRGFLDLFGSWVIAKPNAVAVRCGEQQLTYAELDARSDALAKRIEAAIRGCSTLVGIALPRSVEVVTSELAVLKTHAAFVPLDPSFPAQRIQHMVTDSGMEAMVTFDGVLDGINLGQVVCIDPRENARDASDSHAKSQSGASPARARDLAYAIYTSGSTGIPKGVEVTRAGLDNFLNAMAHRPGMTCTDRLMSVTTPSFDISILELLLPLSCGAEVIVAPSMTTTDGAALRDLLVESGATMMQATPFTWHLLLENQWQPAPGFRVLCGGEPFPPDLAASLLALGCDVWNMYGPTETTIWSSVTHVIDTDMHLGEPIDNTCLCVVDESLRPVPHGVPGELLIGGAGLARGYHDRQELTGERFVTLAQPEGRWYRTGDLVRRGGDGRLRFLGRLDHQVKLHGYRIELGDIESALNGHPGIREALVMVREDVPGDPRLVAYTIPEQTDGDDQVSAWADLWDDAYSSGRAKSGDDFSGWLSSFTSEQIPAEEMTAWSDATAASILALSPTSVLELGGGTGLIMRRVAPSCERYWALDVAPEAVHHLTAIGQTMDSVDTRAFCGPAHELAALPEQDFDVVVINSVMQYFPDAEYARGVILGALDRLTEGGRLFIGDVRSLALVDAFHAVVDAYRQDPRTGLAGREGEVAARIEQDTELCLAPEWFLDLVASSGRTIDVLIAPKPGTAATEMSPFRYDVTLTSVSEPLRVVEPEQWAGGNLAALSRQCAEGPDLLALGPLPNARTAGLRSLLDQPGSAVTADLIEAFEHPCEGFLPEDVVAVAEKHGYQARIDWLHHGRTGAMTLVASRQAGLPVDRLRIPAGDVAGPVLANTPAAKVSHSPQLSEIRERAARQLPGYMLPTALVVLDAWPLTANGKINRKALPAPQMHGDSEDEYVDPQGPTELMLARLYRDVLGIERVSADADFFALGGHSLLATRMVSLLQTDGFTEVRVRDVFAFPVLRDLAAHLVPTGSAGEAGPRIRRAIPKVRNPLSHEQTRLWLLHQIDGPSATYNIPMALRLRGALNVSALRAAFGDVLERHDVLRTVYGSADGVPYAETLPLAEACEGLMPCLEAADEQELDQFVAEACAHAFHLNTEVPLRAGLIRMADDDHVLFIVVHHIAADGSSLGPLAADLLGAYRIRAQGQLPQLGELPVQYADYARFQREMLGDAADPTSRWAQELEYWRTELAGMPTSIILPTDRPHPARASGAGRRVVLPWSPETWQSLGALAERGATTEFVTLEACLAATLRLLGAGDDLGVGINVVGRPDEQTQELVGFFVNTLVVRSRMDGGDRVVDLLERTKMSVADGLDHQSLPFESLVTELVERRDAARHPLVQVMATWNDLPGLGDGFGDVVVEPLTTDAGTARMDLVFAVDRADDGLALTVEYSTDIFEEGTVVALGERLARIIQAAAVAPETTLDELDVVLPDERARTETWNETSREVPDLGICELFDRQAVTTGDALALVDREGSLTYGELLDQVQRVAGGLVCLGVNPGDRVAVLSPRSRASVVGMFASLYAGGVYVPIDTEVPAGRVRHILEQARPRLVICDQETSVDLPEGCGRASVAMLGESDTRLGTPITRELGDPAYIIFTSGSTGRPKGVVVGDGGIASLVLTQTERFGIVPGTGRVLNFASPGFDASIAERCDALCSGAALVIAAKHDLLPGGPLEATCADLGVTQATIPPSVLSQVADGTLPDGMGITVAGEACPLALVKRWAPGRIMINAYGPTETTVCASMTDALEASTDRLGIGRPIANTQMRVVDGRRRMVPLGVPGELAVLGSGLALGYLDREDLTAECFVTSPEDGRRMYLTGDRVLWRQDGELSFLGREDDQIKLRGNRIELAEIESVIASVDGVGQVVAHVIGEGPHASLVAYVVCLGDVEGETVMAAARAEVESALPTYMWPKALVPLRELPLTDNGKVDKALLPLPTLPAQHEGEPARPGAESILAQAFAEVLGVDGMSRDDNFFERGGDSLLAMQVVARAQASGVTVTVRDLFTAPVVRDLALLARSTAAYVDDGSAEAIPPTPMGEWLRTLGGDSDLIQHVAVRLPDSADLATAQAAVKAVVSTHRVLGARRTTDPQGRWCLEVPALADVASGETLVRDLDARTGEAACELASAVDLLRANLDPEQGRMLQAGFLHDEYSPVLLMVCHHLVIDAASWPIITGDLRTVWEQLEAGRTPQLPPVGPTYARWAQGLETAEITTEDRTAWAQLVAGAWAGEDPSAKAGRPTTQTCELSPDVTSRLLRRAVPELGARADEVLLAAVAVAVERVLEGAHGGLLLDVESHGRLDSRWEGADLSRSVGWFTEMHPVCLKVAGQAAAGPIMSRVRRGIEQIRAVPGDGSSYGLLRYLGDDPEASTAVSWAGFNYLGRIASPGGAVPWSNVVMDVAPDFLAHQLEINVGLRESKGDDTLVASWAASPQTAPYLDELMETWLDALAELAESTVGGSPDPVILGPAEPVSFAQRDVISQPVPIDHPHHNVITVSELSGPLDHQALIDALRQVSAYHDALRSTLHQVDGTWSQRIASEPRWPMRRISLLEAEPQAQAHALQELIEQETLHPFDVSDGPLVRGDLVDLAPNRTALILVMHHVVVDPWSFAVIDADLATLYSAITGGTAPTVMSTGSSVNVARRQDTAWRRGECDVDAAYWQQLMRDYEPQPQFLPRAGRTPVPVEGFTVPFVLGKALSEDVARAARTHGATEFTFLLACYSVLLEAFTGRHDIVVGYPSNGREHGADSDVVGFRIAPVLVRPRPVADVASRVRQLMEQESEAARHAEVPLRSLGLFEQEADNPLRILFNLVNVEGGLALDGVDVAPLVLDPQNEAVIPEMVTKMEPHNVDLYLLMRRNGDELRGLWLYNPSRIQPAVMADLVEAFPDLVSAMAADNHGQISELVATLMEA